MWPRLATHMAHKPACTTPHLIAPLLTSPHNPHITASHPTSLHHSRTPSNDPLARQGAPSTAYLLLTSYFPPWGQVFKDLAWVPYALIGVLLVFAIINRIVTKLTEAAETNPRLRLWVHRWHRLLSKGALLDRGDGGEGKGEGEW